MSDLLREDDGNKIYWGNKNKIDTLIDYVNKGINILKMGSGSFGTGYLVAVKITHKDYHKEGESSYELIPYDDEVEETNGPYGIRLYLVKKTHSKDKVALLNRGNLTDLKLQFIKEVDASIEFRQKIPSYVTRIKGARWNNEGPDYIIYNYIKGKTLKEYLNILFREFDYKISGQDFNSHHTYNPNTVQYSLLKEYYDNLCYLWCALEKANLALSNIGWSHSDIKPDNLMFKVELGDKGKFYNWASARCWLIDFGGATQFGHTINTFTRDYSPFSNYGMCTPESKNPARSIRVSPNRAIRLTNYTKDFDYDNAHIVMTPEYNAVSRDIIWNCDMAKLFFNYAEFKIPTCKTSSRGGFNKTRTKRRRSRKFRKDI